MPALPQEVEILSGSTAARTDLVLDRALHTIHGTVRDDTGEPLPNAWVSAATCGLLVEINTNARGVYTLPVGLGTYTVAARTTDYVSEGPQMVSLPPNASGVDFVLNALTFYSITGQVTDPVGQPIEDVWVRASSDAAFSASDWTEEDGRYVLRVSAGTYHVQAREDGYMRPLEQVVTVPPSRKDIDFVMAPSHLQIQGTVRDTGGSPLPSAYVNRRLQGENWSTSLRVYYDGTYDRTVITGTHTLYAWAPCYANATPQNVTLPPSRSDIDFSLAPRDQLISGVVSDTNNLPLCGAKEDASPASDSDETERNGLYALQVPAGTSRFRSPRLDTAPRRISR